ncbi:MAG: hypothetical protein QM689_06550 [Oscillospiraceae bacterium]
MADLTDGALLTEPSENPLLSIDTNFRQYLNAYTRSFQNHVVDGALDYAFDADFAVRQKITGLAGWNKLLKAIVSQDVTAEAKFLFSKFNQAGPLKYPDIYDIVKLCAERLELNLPIVIVRDDTDKPLIYSISTEIIEPCIVVSTGLLKFCTKEELLLLVGMECGRIQNNHCVYQFAVTYININRDVFKPAERSYKQTLSSQIIYMLPEWILCADITCDRAGIICCDEPADFPRILAGIYAKGYLDFFGRSYTLPDTARLTEAAEKLTQSGVRSIKTDKTLSRFERRLLAAHEFLRCDSLYGWRRDLDAAQIHTQNRQVCDVRTNLIAGNSATDPA